MLRNALVLSSLLAATSAFADPGRLAGLFAGKYTVDSADCLETGNLKGAGAEITAVNNTLTLHLKGAKPSSIFVMGGRGEQKLPNGNTLIRAGFLFNNGIKYGEEERNGSKRMPKFDLLMLKETGKIKIDLNTHHEARATTTTRCVLAPAR